MEFIRLSKTDLDSYFANRLRALKDSPSAFLTTYEEEKARGNSHFEKTLSHEGDDRAIFGAIADGILVGTIGIFKEDRPKICHKSIIWGMYVDVDYRGKRIGAQLLDRALDFARSKMNVNVVGLSVESTNLNARKLYESRGFKVWGTEPYAMKQDGLFFNEDHMLLVLFK